MPCIANPPASRLNRAGGRRQPGRRGQPGVPQPAGDSFPNPAASPNAGEFGANWGAMSLNPGSAQQPMQQVPLNKRIDLNRGFVDYPLLTSTPVRQPGRLPAALQDRQTMAQEIFNMPVTVTGAKGNGHGRHGPVTVNAAPGTPQYDALRWLAQLAVNIVDFVDSPTGMAHQIQPAPDDIMTTFNWNPAQRTAISRMAGSSAPSCRGWCSTKVHPGRQRSERSGPAAKAAQGHPVRRQLLGRTAQPFGLPALPATTLSAPS